MEALFNVVELMVWYVSAAVVAYILARSLTSKVKPALNFKPFNCWGCLAFWFTFILGTIIAVIYIARAPEITGTAAAFALWLLIGWAFLIGLINYFYIKSKFKIYE